MIAQRLVFDSISLIYILNDIKLSRYLYINISFMIVLAVNCWKFIFNTLRIDKVHEGFQH